MSVTQMAMTRLLRPLAGAGIAAAAVLAATPARATADGCNDAYVETQRLRRTGRLLRAREQALACARDECSVTVRRDCSAWLEDIAEAMPSVVVEARDEAGNEVLDVRVFSGDELLAPSLDGKALPLDPGAHELRFEHRGQIETVRVLALEGQAYRHIAVRFRAPSEPPPSGSLVVAAPAPGSEQLQQVAFVPSEPLHRDALPRGTAVSPSTMLRGPAPQRLPSSSTTPSGEPLGDQPRSIPLATHVFGGVGLASLTAFGLLATSAYTDERDLRERCGRQCSPGAVDSVHERYLMADVALAFGISSLVAAGALYLFLPDADPHPPAQLGVGLRGAHLRFDARF